MHMASRKIILVVLSAVLVMGYSCMKDKPEEFPEGLVWNPGLAFPLDIDTFGLNAESGFDTTLFQLDTLTGLPLWVNELEVVMTGQTAFDLGMLSENIEDIRRIMVRTNIYNGFPHEVAIQAYFAQWDSTLIDSLFQEGPLVVRPASPMGSGEATRASYTRKDAHFEQEELRALENSEVLYLRAVVATTEVDSAMAAFYRDYLLILDVGFLAQLSYTF